MGLIQWYDTANAGDCLDSVGTWNDMIDYIKHSACTDFTIHSDCTDTGQAFRFTQHGTNSLMYGGADTGDDLQIIANDTDIYPYIKLLGDGDAEIWVANNDFLWFYEGGIKAIRFSADSNDSQIRGRDNTLGHLSLWANTIDAYPYIKLSGGGSIELHADLNDEIIFYEQANERFKFEEHQIDFNADRAIYINDDNTFIGHGAGDNIAAGTNNTLVGHDAGQANNFSNCAFFGYEAGKNNTANNSVGIGHGAVNTNNQTGTIGIGYNALQNNTGHRCTAIGYMAMDAANTGANNTALGYEALTANLAGHSNAAFGRYVLASNTSGYSNAGLGMSTLNNCTTGDENVAVGAYCGVGVILGNANTHIGYYAGYDNDVSGTVLIGWHAGEANANSNRLYINNSNSVFPLIYGEFDNDKVKFGNNSDDWNFQFSHDGTYSILEGGTNTADHLKLKANSTDAEPFIYISGSGWITYMAQDIANGVHDFMRGSADRAARITHDGTSVAQWTGGTRNGETLLITCNSGDGNGDITLATGTGVVQFGTYAAKGAEAFAGFVTIKDDAGNSRKVMICA